jgi:hypothetical protein
MATVEIGQLYRRRCEIAGDAWNHIEVIGRYEQKEISEFVVRPTSGFDAAVSVAPADLLAAFDLERAAPPGQPEDIATGQAWV